LLREFISPGSMFIEVGPASIVVRGEKEGQTFVFDKRELNECLIGILSEVRESLPVLRQKAYKIRKTTYMAEVAKRMVAAAKTVDEATLTPMAAVAGAIADVVKDRLKEKFLDFASVNNGGDISIFNERQKPARIGIGDIERNKPTRYTLTIRGLKEFGVATSGFGGRSFTLGVADSVTVLAGTGAVADAAATFICNRTNVQSGEIVRRRASEIDPLSDIGSEWVTVKVGDLDADLVKKALQGGLDAGEEMKKRGIILDTVILLRGESVITSWSRDNTFMEVEYGNQEAGDNRRGRIC
jgi:ApbE superfamily uncharacterized protein (UPF0280 family)